MRTFAILLVAAFAGCGETVRPGITETREVSADDPGLEQKGPLLFHEKELLTGKVTLRSAKGDLLSTTAYVAGKKEGPSATFHPDGSRETTRTYRDNRKTGVHEAWWPGGGKKFVAHHRDGVYEGSVKEWFENGNPYRSFLYRDGHEDGPQKMWNPDGTLRANYVARNGRRYGWISSMPCSSPLKETLVKMESSK
jgi:antitoxin component YwqK of YwqJK toxin-antitoxin module